MKRARLEQILNRFPEMKIAVLGDLFLDKWLQIDRSLDEVSRETGLTAYQVVSKRIYAGAGGTVLSNLAALEVGELLSVGFVGDDGEGCDLLRLLKRLHVNTEHVAVSDQVMTPTYTKPVFMLPEGEKEINRLDYKNTRPTPVELEEQMIRSIWEVAEKVDVVIALDQLEEEGCGVLTPRVRRELSEIASRYPQLIIYADSRAFGQEFQNMIIKCNDIEVSKIYMPEVSERLPLEQVGRFLERLATETRGRVFITCGEKGVLVHQDGAIKLVPTVPQGGKIDIVGAGDACTSGIVTTLCAGGSDEEAAFVGNLVSSVTIQVIGTTGVATRQQVLARYDDHAAHWR